jgi:hypothetical protein
MRERDSDNAWLGRIAGVSRMWPEWSSSPAASLKPEAGYRIFLRQAPAVDRKKPRPGTLGSGLRETMNPPVYSADRQQPSLPMALEFRQLGDIGRDPSGLVPGEQLGCGLPAHPCRPLREPVDCLPHGNGCSVKQVQSVLGCPIEWIASFRPNIQF